ncbi:MAG TPA: CPBP family intramembrane glutamic endopeptidase [Allosphingosinicella sp.]
MRRILGYLGLAGFAIGAFVCSLLPGGVWAALLSANLRTGIAIPWAVPAALALLAVGWRFAGGQSPWRSEIRAAYRRANPVSARAFGWAMLANAFALAALGGLWILLHHLVRTHGNPVPDFSAYPLPVVGAVLACAAIVGAVGEEVALRGYLLGRLQRRAPWPVAVALVALIAAPGHALTQGFVWPTLLFYVLADLTYGITACLTDSILPGIVAHAAGLFVFFAFIWPHDASRSLTTLDNNGLWTSIGQVALSGALAVWAFSRLARTAASDRAARTVADIGTGTNVGA